MTMTSIALTLRTVLLSLVAGSVAVQAAKGDPALPPPGPPPLYDQSRPDVGLDADREKPSAGRLQLARLQPTVPPAQPDDEFVPVSELPPEERLPAAPMLVAAYAFVVLAVFAYMLSLSRRLSAVGREILRLEEQVRRGGPS